MAVSFLTPEMHDNDQNDQQSAIVKTDLTASSLFRKLPEMACHVQAWEKAYSVLKMQDHLLPLISKSHSPSLHKRQAQQLSSSRASTGPRLGPTHPAELAPPTHRQNHLGKCRIGTWEVSSAAALSWKQDSLGCCFMPQHGLLHRIQDTGGEESNPLGQASIKQVASLVS